MFHLLFPHLIYPHAMVVFYLELTLLFILAIATIDIFIALWLLMKQDKKLDKLGADILTLLMYEEKRRLDADQKQDEPCPVGSDLGKYLSGLTEEQKASLRETYLESKVDTTTRKEDEKHYVEPETSTSEMLNEPASLASGIPMFDKVKKSKDTQGFVKQVTKERRKSKPKSGS